VSDIGLYAALEAELIAALTGISGVATLVPTVSVDRLAGMDGVRKPAIGVIDTGAEFREQYAITKGRSLATVSWDIAIVVQNMRGVTAARPTVRTLLETIRDRVHWLQTGTSSKGRYRWRSDQHIQLPDDSLDAAVASFEIAVSVGT